MITRQYFKHGFKIYWTFIMLLCLCLLSCGCLHTLDSGGEKEPVEYTICKDSSLPGQLQMLLEEKKKEAGTFTYKTSMYMYLVVCYGSKPYSGYSVQVEKCYRTEDTLFLQTQLMGPKAGEKVVETETYPYIVLQCEWTDAFCVIES